VASRRSSISSWIESQAVRVATLHPVDLERIERWARGEGPHGEERFQEFERRLPENQNE
jgi:hypothetical protein